MTRRALGELEKLVLIAVVALGDDAYGASIRREIEDRTGRDVPVGAIYTALDRLSRRDAVESSVAGPTAERGGRRRKVYRLRPDGARDLRRSLETMDAMTRGLDDLADRLAREAAG